MHWDVVEVKPEPNHSLLVRFRDGLSGHVRLHEDDLVGVLAPLRDEAFFRQVFIDHGAVAWPGEIDLAPDAMYEEITRAQGYESEVRSPIGEPASRRRWPRLWELADLAYPSNPDAYFQDFADRKHERAARDLFDILEKQLTALDETSWAFIKEKVPPYLAKNPNTGDWRQLGELLDGPTAAHGYLRSRGCANIRFIPEAAIKTPDIEATLNGRRVLCEVKTVNYSDRERAARHAYAPSARNVENFLRPEFFLKLDSNIRNAKDKFTSYDPLNSADHCVFFRINFDDWSGIYREEYFAQICQHFREQPPGVTVIGSVALSDNTCVVAKL